MLEMSANTLFTAFSISTSTLSGYIVSLNTTVYRRGHGFNSCWSLRFFFWAFFALLLKVASRLWRSISLLFFIPSSYMIYIICTSSKILEVQNTNWYEIHVYWERATLTCSMHIITRARRHRVLKWAPFVFHIFIFIFIFFLLLIFLFFLGGGRLPVLCWLVRGLMTCSNFWNFFHALFNGGFDCRPSLLLNKKHQAVESSFHVHCCSVD